MTSDSAYFLRSTHIGFRIWLESDRTLAEQLWGNPDVTRLIGGPFSEVHIDLRLKSEIAQLKNFGVQYWPIFLTSNDVFIGCCGLRPYRLEDQIYEIGVHLLPEYYGKGLAFESVREVIRHGFDNLGAKALFAGHNPANFSSKRLLEKLGFVYTHDEFYEPTGLLHPSYLLKDRSTPS